MIEFVALAGNFLKHFYLKMLKYSSMDGWIDVFMYLINVLSFSSLMDGMYFECRFKTS